MDYIGLYDLILNRYANIEFVLNLEAIDGVKLIEKAKEQYVDRLYWEKWISSYTDLDFYSFKSESQTTISDRPIDEILKDAERIRKAVKANGDI